MSTAIITICASISKGNGHLLLPNGNEFRLVALESVIYALNYSLK